MASAFNYSYELPGSFMKYYTPSYQKISLRDKYLTDIAWGWKVPENALEKLNRRQLKRLLQSLKIGKLQATKHRTLLEQYRRNAVVVQIYK